MEERKKRRWNEMKEQILSTPELRESYERDKSELLMTRQLLMKIDAEREHAGLSKADLARRIGKDPAAVRRMFSSRASNPTLGTILQMAGALGMKIEVVKQKRSEPTATVTAKHQKTRRGKEATA